MKFISRSMMVAALSSLFALGCSNPGTTTVGNPSPNAITFGAVQNNTAALTLPLTVLGGDASTLSQTQISVYQQGVPLASQTADTIFNTSENSGLISIASAASQQSISVVVETPSGESVYSSVLSTTSTSRSALSCSTTTNAAERIACGICSRVSSCATPTSTIECLAGILSTDQVDIVENLGVPLPENSISMQQVVEAENNGQLTANNTRLGLCLSQINGLSCTEIGTGYTSTDPNNYANIENFIPESTDSCAGVYASSPVTSVIPPRPSTTPVSTATRTVLSASNDPLSVSSRTLTNTEISSLLTSNMTIEELRTNKLLSYLTVLGSIADFNGLFSTPCSGHATTTQTLLVQNLSFRSTPRTESFSNAGYNYFSCFEESDKTDLNLTLGSYVVNEPSSSFLSVLQNSPGGFSRTPDSHELFASSDMRLTTTLPTSRISFSGTTFSLTTGSSISEELLFQNLPYYETSADWIFYRGEVSSEPVTLTGTFTVTSGKIHLRYVSESGDRSIINFLVFTPKLSTDETKLILEVDPTLTNVEGGNIFEGNYVITR